MIYDSDYEVRLATLQKLGGDITKCYDSVYEIDLAILDAIQGAGAVIDDNEVSTGKTWSSSKIVSELADAGFDIEIVSELPTTGDPHTIYFIASSSQVTGNVYDEYMYINGNWEQVGSTAVDLSQYATKEWVNTSLGNYATSNDISTFITSNDVSIYAEKTYVDASLAGKQDTLTAGSGIDITNNVISATGGGGGINIVELTQDEYDALSTAQKNDGSIYSITNASIITPLAKADADTYYNPINTTTASATGYKFPTWNANGQINGTTATAYQASQSVNGSSRTLYSTSSSALPTIYAPTSAGTAGQYLVSSGSGAPTWQALEVASDYVIADADASTGTYSSDIAAFYTKTIYEDVIQGVQIKIVDEHVVDNVSVYSDSYYLPSSSRIYEGNVELWLMYTEDGATWENIHYLITNNSITRDVSTGSFGPVNNA